MDYETIACIKIAIVLACSIMGFYTLVTSED